MVVDCRMEELMKQDSSQHQHRIWDRLGISASALCLVHCVALPFLLAGIPALARFEASLGSGVHMLMAVLVVATVVPALRGGFRRHRDVPTLAFGSWGLVLILVGLFAGDGHGSHDHGSTAAAAHGHHDHDHDHDHGQLDATGSASEEVHNHSLFSRETLFTMFGSGLLVTAHIRNLTKCREGCKLEGCDQHE